LFGNNFHCWRRIVFLDIELLVDSFIFFLSLIYINHSTIFWFWKFLLRRQVLTLLKRSLLCDISPLFCCFKNSLIGFTTSVDEVLGYIYLYLSLEFRNFFVLFCFSYYWNLNPGRCFTPWASLQPSECRSFNHYVFKYFSVPFSHFEYPIVCMMICFMISQRNLRLCSFSFILLSFHFSDWIISVSLHSSSLILSSSSQICCIPLVSFSFWLLYISRL
jgi:hypothetical protein